MTTDDSDLWRRADEDAPVKNAKQATRVASGSAAATARSAAASALAQPARTGSPATAADDGRPTAVYVASLTWWTTDAELEVVLAEYGRVKSLTFFADKATGKSKGCCAVEFATADAAAACKEKLHGQQINGKPCVVTFAEIPKTTSTLGAHEPLPPPPDTAWKGPIPPDKPGYGGVPYVSPQQMAMMQQQMMQTQQQAKRAPPPPPPLHPAQWTAPPSAAAAAPPPAAAAAPPPPPKRRRR